MSDADLKGVTVSPDLISTLNERERSEEHAKISRSQDLI